MARRFPEIRTALDRHLEDVGELLPHVLMWDIVRLTTMAYEGESNVDWRSLLSFFEAHLADRDQYVSELIGTSFLESLPGPKNAGHGIVLELGPLATAMFNELRPAG
jgi:hypothetical protein